MIVVIFLWQHLELGLYCNSVRQVHVYHGLIMSVPGETINSECIGGWTRTVLLADKSS